MDTTQGITAVSGESSSRAVQEHVSSSFAYKIVSSNVSDFSKPFVSYRGEDAAEMFVRKLQEETKQLFDEHIATPKPLLPLTAAELRSFHTAINFIYAINRLEVTVCDYCHLAGIYSGTAHSRCNLMYRISKSGWQLLVVIHNLKGYDWHLITKALKNEFGKVRVIPQNMEKYLSLTVGRLKSIDSFQSTPQSLIICHQKISRGNLSI